MKISAIESCILTVPTSKQMALEFPHRRLVVERQAARWRSTAASA